MLFAERTAKWGNKMETTTAQSAIVTRTAEPKKTEAKSETIKIDNPNLMIRKESIAHPTAAVAFIPNYPAVDLDGKHIDAGSHPDEAIVKVNYNANELQVRVQGNPQVGYAITAKEAPGASFANQRFSTPLSRFETELKQAKESTEQIIQKRMNGFAKKYRLVGEKSIGESLAQANPK